MAFLKTLRGLNPYKTLWFNLKMFPFKTALKLPALVYGKVKFVDLKGRVVLDCPARRGLMRIGSQSLAILDPKIRHVIWDMMGDIRIKGPFHLGPGSRITTNEGSTLEFGAGFNATGNVTIVCGNEIRIGEDCLMAWDITLIDTDHHKIFDRKGNRLNPWGKVVIGDHCWIGCNTLLKKGAVIPDGSVVAAGSVVSKKFSEEGVIIADDKIVRREIVWKH